MAGDFSPQTPGTPQFGSLTPKQKVADANLLNLAPQVVDLVGKGMVVAQQYDFTNNIAPELQSQLEGLTTSYEAGDLSKQQYQVKLRNLNKTYVAESPERRGEIQSMIRSASASAAAPAQSAQQAGEQAGIKALYKEATMLGTSVEAVQAMKLADQRRSAQSQQIALSSQTRKIASNEYLQLAQQSFNTAQVALQNRTAQMIKDNGGEPLDAAQRRQLTAEYYQAVNTVQGNLDKSYRANAERFGAGVIDGSAVSSVNTMRDGFLKIGQQVIDNFDDAKFYQDQVAKNESLITLGAQETFGKFMQLRKGVGDRGLEQLSEMVKSVAGGNNSQIAALKSNPYYGAMFQTIDAQNGTAQVVDGVTQLSGVLPEKRGDIPKPQTSTMATGDTNVQGVAMSLTDPRTDAAVVKGFQGENKAEVTQHIVNTVKVVPDIFSTLRRPTYLANKQSTPEIGRAVDEGAKAYAQQLRVVALADGRLDGDITNKWRLTLTEESQTVSVPGPTPGGNKDVSKPTGRLVIDGLDASPTVKDRINQMYQVLKVYPEVYKQQGYDTALDALKGYLKISE